MQKHLDYLHRTSEIDNKYSLPNNAALLAWYAGVSALDVKRKTDLRATFPELTPLWDLAVTETERQKDQTLIRTS